MSDEMKIVLDDGEVASLMSSSSSTKAKKVVVGAIDQGTSSTRFVLFSAQTGQIVASSQVEHEQIFPVGQAGWHEHDPLVIWSKTKQCIVAVVEAVAAKGILLVGPNNKNKNSNSKKTVVELAAIGITNQRETTIAWNRLTGKPYYNAIVWDDLRTTSIVKDLTAGGDINRLRDQTGLPLASYFAGTKVKWLLDNVTQLREDLMHPATRDNVCFGTVDAWLVYQLTGTATSSSADDTASNTGGIFVTDVTNASRWLFMDLKTQQWDQKLVDAVCAPHDIPIATALPKICPSSRVYGTCQFQQCGISFTTSAAAAASSLMDANDGIPVAAILGDQQAALFGQTAFAPGQAKNTYGTGLFLMMNTGTQPVHSTHGLLTTVAYQLTDGPVHFALEGSVSHSGSTIQWLRDALQIISSAPESETVARTVADNAGLYFVPAFSGLFAPHWRSDARACIVGMTASHHKGHVCRAALEAAAYQTREVFEAIMADAAVQLQSLRVDGGGTHNRLLMQFQADMIQVPVIQPVVMETTSMGAAFCAGLAVGVWKDLDEISQLWAVAQTYTPTMETAQRNAYWKGWKKAVTKSLDWEEREAAADDDDDDEFVDALSGPTSSFSDEIATTDKNNVWSPKKKAKSSSPSRLAIVTPAAIVTIAALCVGFLLGSTRNGKR